MRLERTSLLVFSIVILLVILVSSAIPLDLSRADIKSVDTHEDLADVVVWSEDFDVGIPAGWTVVDNVGASLVWTDVISSGESANYTGGAGDAATVSSDHFGKYSFDTELRTPPFDLPSGPSAVLQYRANYQSMIHHDTLDVDISTDGGDTWTNLLRWNEDHGPFRAAPGEMVEVDISPYLGMDGLMLRWRYYDPRNDAWDWYAQIDDVSVVIRSVDLELAKTIIPTGDIALGAPVTYTLVYTNHGPSIARDVIISDPLPNVLTNVHYAGAAITATGSLSYTWQVTDLAPGIGGVFTITGVLEDDLTGGLVFTNTATITTATAESDPGNNSGAVAATVSNLSPALSPFSDQTIYANTRLGPLAFTVEDSDGPIENLTLRGESSNETLAPSDNISFGGAGIARSVTITPAADLTGTTIITITVEDGTDSASSAFRLTVKKHTLYLPLALSRYVAAPDLVVEHIIAASDGMTIAMRNQGNAPVVDDFWVDIYVAPHPAPTAVNQIWNNLCDEGLVWGVTGDIPPGEAITLTIGDAFYHPEYSRFSAPLPAGTPIYAQVDSANADTVYGAVLESHEITGEEYNNIAGPEFYTSTPLKSTLPKEEAVMHSHDADDDRLPDR